MKRLSAKDKMRIEVLREEAERLTKECDEVDTTNRNAGWSVLPMGFLKALSPFVRATARTLANQADRIEKGNG